LGLSWLRTLFVAPAGPESGNDPGVLPITERGTALPLPIRYERNEAVYIGIGTLIVIILLLILIF
jgi:hypothetical protein